MDKLRKHIHDREDRLNVEKIGDHVWFNISKNLPKNKKQKYYRTTIQWFVNWLGSPGKNYGRWAFSVLLPLLLIISSAFNIKHNETIGSVISFAVQSADSAAIEKILRLEGSRQLYFKRLKNVDSSVIFLVSFVKGREVVKVEKIMGDLSLIGSVMHLTKFPVNLTTKESILSYALYKVFDIHIDLKKSIREETIKDISAHFKQRGIKNTQVIISQQGDSVSILPVVEQHIPRFTAIKPGDSVTSDSIMTRSLKVEKHDKPAEKITTPQKLDEARGNLIGFAWLLHTWKTLDSSQNSFHRWVKVSSSLYRSFVIRLDPETTVKPAYYLYTNDSSIYLARDNDRWLLQEKSEWRFTFQRESQQFPHRVKWDRSDKIWWFRQITGSLKDETALYIDDAKNRRLDSVLWEYKKQNPALFR